MKTYVSALGRHGLRALIATAAVLVAGGCGDAPEPVAPVAQPVKTVRAGGVSADGRLEFPGEIAPSQNAQPAFEVSGKIVEFPVDEAQFLAEGDVIARLDPRDFQSEVDRAQANVDKTAADLKRYQTLYDKGVSPLTDLESAKRRFQVTEAELKTAQKALDDTVLRAPFAGTVARKLAKDFQNVQAKEPIVILQDDTTLEIVVNVPESDFAGMKPGLSIEERNRNARAEVSVSSIAGRTFPARIKEFSTTADPVSRTFQARFSFQPPDDVSVRPGMTAMVSVRPGAKPESARDFAIPVQAVRTDDTDQAFVWVVNPDTMTVTRTPVTTGEMAEGNITILDGLPRGSEIVTSGVYHLRDGMKIRRLEQ